MSDLIDRLDALNAINALCILHCEDARTGVYVDCEVCRIGEVTNAIETLRNARPERKTAKWVASFDGQFTGGAYWFHCSKCNRTVPGGLQSGYHFCPNCGARMEE